MATRRATALAALLAALAAVLLGLWRAAAPPPAPAAARAEPGVAALAPSRDPGAAPIAAEVASPLRAAPAAGPESTDSARRPAGARRELRVTVREAGGGPVRAARVHVTWSGAAPSAARESAPRRAADGTPARDAAESPLARGAAGGTRPDGAGEAAAGGDGAEGSTDAQGVARIAVPAAVGRWRARVRAEGFLEAVAEGEGDALALALERAAVLAGQVVDRDTGAGVAGARVRWASAGSGAAVGSSTAADGGFALTLPAGRRARLVVEAEGYASEAGWHDVPGGAAGGASPARIVLTPIVPGALRARVVDAVTGRPIEGARLRRVTGRGRESFARSDAAGVVRAALSSGWREQDLDLVVTATGYCGLAARLRGEDLDGRAWTLPLLPPTALRGVVVGGAGEPCAGVRVQVTGRRGTAVEPAIRERLEGAGLDRAVLGAGLLVTQATGSAWATTGDDGTFAFENLVPWKEGVAVEARDGRRASEAVELEALAGPGGTAWVELVLERTASVHGVVTARGDVEAAGRVRWVAGDAEGFAEVDSGGAYRVDDLPAGPLTLEPVARRRTGGGDGGRLYAPGLAARGRVEVRLRPGEDRAVPLELELAAAPVAGRVTTAAGAPLRGLPVYARAADADDPEYVVSTDDDGAFGFDVDAGAGPFVVSLRHGGRWIAREGVRAGDAAVDFEVPEGTALLLRVRDARTGAAVDAYHVSARAAGDDGFRLLATSAGRDPDEDGFRAYEVPADTASALVHHPGGGYRPFEVAAIGEPGGSEAGAFDVLLEPGVHVDLRLAPGVGPLPEGVALYLVEDGRAFEPPADPDGGSLSARLEDFTDYVRRERRVAFDRGPAARVEGLAPGRYRLVVAGGGGSVSVRPEAIDVGPDGADVELAWSE